MSTLPPRKSKQPKPVEFPPRLSLSLRPTLIQHLPRLSARWGVELYCKRDDLTGFGFGGNKIRKLEFLLKEALDRGCDSVVTCGSNQSNWARMTATAAAVLGMDAHLVLGGGKPARATANLLLDELVGATIHYRATGEDDELERASRQCERQLSAEGRHPVRLVVGGSNGLGTFGYLDAMTEIMAWEREHDLRFDAVVAATGSGGTQAGLVAGQTLFAWPGRVIGMNVSRGRDAQITKVRGILAEFDRLTGAATTAADILCEDAYVGEGYRHNTVECEEAVSLFARHEGIFLDEVYTGKAAAGLIDYCRRGLFPEGARVLFLHTGGAVQLFE